MGHMLQETLGNGLITTRQYNPLTNRLESIAAGPNGSIQSLSMSYDAVGNLTSRSDGVMNWTESFSYDALNRITGVSGPAVKSYAYDAIGNITNKSDVGAYTYGDPKHVHAVTQAGGNTYTYDANGNMLSGGGRTLTWTSFDRPASISTANAYVSMGYDANHTRISKTNTITGEVTRYIGGDFEEVSLAGVIKAKHYIQSGNGLVAIMEQVATLKTMKYVHNDQLGSINVITDSTGTVLERLSFDAFGKPRNTDATDTVNTIIAVHTTRGYTGHKMDAEVGLINMNARLYDPTLGRFISADVTIDDPFNMQTFDRYSYVVNNPFKYVDLSGNVVEGLTIGATASSTNPYVIAAEVIVAAYTLITLTSPLLASVGRWFGGGAKSAPAPSPPSQAPPPPLVPVQPGGYHSQQTLTWSIITSANAGEAGFNSPVGEVTANTDATQAQAYLRLNGEISGQNNYQWGTMDFVNRYFTGGGDVTLKSVGLGSSFENAASVQSQVRDFIIGTIIYAQDGYSFSDRGVSNVTWEPNLFSVGKSPFFKSVTCSRGLCIYNFGIKDWFRDPIGVELPGGTPYRISHSWSLKVAY
ncbi:RHS repeat domain-containing protein [Mariprofundus erugo]|uniref:RHS repeat domain-containing protein n=1 Tax=Mariprofundus erugo TaxID=2528639 RepID=UPI001EE7F011|nr:RHS repeat-associated core domain-containing protein [Mariprofundus erugo]